ncbi:chemotaxis protein CheW [candidate division KSB3 bacterium]|uniref:Chemotaxis protein CheW n=1 Tax=candidate division KSB3 bacterium TaxID=2044937 RepID=A0A2G6KF74_9BACT|nr:MAG: chemotaxis protein CheW [candidate division KSB3 bacterium]
MSDERQQQTGAGIVQLATFFLEGELFGVKTLHVQEILTYQEITPVPLAPDYVRGLINLRGQIVTVIDLRCRLGFEKIDDRQTSMNVIVNFEEGLMSLLVDNIGNVLDIPEDSLLPPPGTIRGITVHDIQAVCQLDDELLIVLDLQSILHLN